MRSTAAALVPILAVTFVDVLGTMVMVPLLPYVAQHYGASGVVVGALLTVSAAASTIAAPVWGAVSDRVGRKTVVVCAQCISLAGYIVLAVASSLAVIFAARGVAGLGGGGIAVTQSYIADVTAPQHRDRAYAAFGAVFGLAIVLGPMLGGFLIRYGFGVPFAVAAVIELITIGLTLRFLPHVAPKAGRSPALRDALGVVSSSAPVRTLLARHGLFIFAVTAFFSTFALYLRHELGLGPDVASWLLAGAGATGGVTLVLLVMRVTRRVGDAVVAQSGLALLALAYAALAYVRTVWLFAAALVAWAIGAACIEPTLTALLSRAAPERARGAIMGLNDAGSNLALIVAPVLSGYAFDRDPHLVGIMPAAAALLALALGFVSRAELRSS